MPPENSHLTVAFLGEHPEPVIEDVHLALDKIRAPGFALTLSGVLFAVERWGMTGVAVAVACGGIVQNVAMWLAARHYTGMWTHASLPDPAVVRGLLKPPRSGN